MTVGGDEDHFFVFRQVEVAFVVVKDKKVVTEGNGVTTVVDVCDGHVFIQRFQLLSFMYTPILKKRAVVKRKRVTQLKYNQLPGQTKRWSLSNLSKRSMLWQKIG